MQRLTREHGAEHGAVAILMALLIPIVLGFAALAVDIAAVYADRQQLQTGADAAALAVASDCASGVACDAGSIDGTATTMAQANKNDGAATGDATMTSGSNTVEVTASSVRQHWFAPVLGVASTNVSASSKVSWGAPSGGTASLPVAFSICEFNAQTGGGLPSGTSVRTLQFTKSSETTCTGPSGNIVPGGFGWLDVNSGTCSTTSVVAAIVGSSTGKSIPSSCTTGDLDALQGQTVLLPIFDDAYDTGSGASYRVMGYAAFTITGYHFGPSKYSYNSACKGEERCIHGYFTRFLDSTDDFSYGAGAPDLGGYVATLELQTAGTT